MLTRRAKAEAEAKNSRKVSGKSSSEKSVQKVKKVIKKKSKSIAKKEKAKAKKSGPRMKTTEMKVEDPKTNGFIIDESPEAQELLTEYGLSSAFKVTRNMNVPAFYSEKMFGLINDYRTLPSLDELKEKVIAPLDEEFGESTFTISPGK